MVSDKVFCASGETIHVTRNTQIHGGGRLALVGATLMFDGPYTLGVHNGGELSLDSSDVVLRQGDTNGYTILTQSEAIVRIAGTQANPTTITGAGLVAIEAAGAQISYLEYSGNASGLILTAANAIVYKSKFYNNHNCGLRVESGARHPITVRKSEFYADTDTQEVGILLQSSQSALIDSNYIHHNSKAGIRLFAPYPDSLDGCGYADMTPVPLPNTLRVNRVTHNADGIIAYTHTNIIEDPALIDSNVNYGFVGIDIWDQPLIQDIGVHNGAKILHLRSTRVGALVFNGQYRIPDRTVYVGGCERDFYGCMNPTPPRSSARHYEDYSVTYNRVKINNVYFTSDLATDGVIRTIRGVSTVFTPRFLFRDYSVDNSGQEVDYCYSVFPDVCSFRAVTLFGSGSEEYGKVFAPWPTRRQKGDEFGYFIFQKRDPYDFALMFGDLDADGCGGRSQRPDSQESQPPARPPLD